MKRIIKNLLFIFVLISFLFLTSCGKKVTVKFNTNCDIIINDITINYGQIVDKPADLEVDDMLFMGWYLDDKPFDFTKGVTEDITLVAKLITAREEELKTAEEILAKYKDIEGYKYCTERLARIIYTYNIDYNYLNNLFNDKTSLVNNLIEDEKLEDTIAFSLYYSDIILELENKKTIDNTLELSEDLISKATTHYSALINTGLYTTEDDNFLDDEKYLGFILPVLYNSLTYYNQYKDVKIWLHDAVKNKYLEYFEVTINEDVYTFTNRITKLTHTFKEIELLNLIDSFNKTYNGDLIKLINYYKSLYKKFVLRENQLNGLNLLLNNDKDIKEIIKNDLTNISYSIESINSTYNIILGFENKIKELSSEFETYSNKEDLKNAIVSAIDFKDQVLIELENVLPKLDIMLEFKKIYELLGFENLSLNDGYETIPVINIDLVNNYYNETLELINDLIEELKKINEDNYNIDLLVDSVFNQDYENSELKEELNRIENTFSSIISKSALMDFSVYEIFDILDIVTSINGISISNINENLFKDILTDELINELVSLLDQKEITYTKDDLNNLYSIINIMNGSSTVNSIEELDNYINTLIKPMDKLSKEVVELLKNCLVELIYVENRDISYQKSIEFVNVIINNYEGFEEYLKVFTYTKTLNNALNNTLYKDLSYSKRSKAIILEQFKYLDNFINSNNEQLIIKLLREVNDTNIYYFDQDIIDNLKNSIKQCIDILSSEQIITTEQKEIINKTGELFGFEYYY